MVHRACPLRPRASSITPPITNHHITIHQSPSAIPTLPYRAAPLHLWFGRHPAIHHDHNDPIANIANIDTIANIAIANTDTDTYI